MIFKRNQLSRLKEAKFLKGFKKEKNILILKYKKITINYKDIDYPLGEFDVKIDLNENCHSIEMKSNKTFLWERKTMINDEVISKLTKEIIHPHIHLSGSPCFGMDRENKIDNLIEEKKYYDLAYMILLFLKQFNEGTEYNHIKYFTKERIIK